MSDTLNAPRVYYLISVWVNQINYHSQIMVSVQFCFVDFFQRSWLVFDKPEK